MRARSRFAFLAVLLAVVAGVWWAGRAGATRLAPDGAVLLGALESDLEVHSAFFVPDQDEDGRPELLTIGVGRGSLLWRESFARRTAVFARRERIQLLGSARGRLLLDDGDRDRRRADRIWEDVDGDAWPEALSFPRDGVDALGPHGVTHLTRGGQARLGGALHYADARPPVHALAIVTIDAHLPFLNGHDIATGDSAWRYPLWEGAEGGEIMWQITGGSDRRHGYVVVGRERQATPYEGRKLGFDLIDAADGVMLEWLPCDPVPARCFFGLDRFGFFERTRYLLRPQAGGLPRVLAAGIDPHGVAGAWCADFEREHFDSGPEFAPTTVAVEIVPDGDDGFGLVTLHARPPVLAFRAPWNAAPRWRVELDQADAIGGADAYALRAQPIPDEDGDGVEELAVALFLRGAGPAGRTRVHWSTRAGADGRPLLLPDG